VKSIRSSVDRKPLKDAAAIRQTACRLGCRQVTSGQSLGVIGDHRLPLRDVSDRRGECLAVGADLDRNLLHSPLVQKDLLIAVAGQVQQLIHRRRDHCRGGIGRAAVGDQR